MTQRGEGVCRPVIDGNQQTLKRQERTGQDRTRHNRAGRRRRVSIVTGIIIVRKRIWQWHKCWRSYRNIKLRGYVPGSQSQPPHQRSQSLIHNTNVINSKSKGRWIKNRGSYLPNQFPPPARTDAYGWHFLIHRIEQTGSAGVALFVFGPRGPRSGM